jgi:shikimate dehydrogenase
VTRRYHGWPRSTVAAGRPVPGGHTGAVLEPRLQSPPAPPASTAVTRRAAVLGMPIEHSLSPVLHTAAYAALGLSGWHYGKHAVDEDGLPGFVADLGPEWVGLSLTMPLKRVALDVATEVTPDTAAVGAANTLVRRGTGWLASNTDVAGIEQALRAVGVTSVDRAVIVGAGGTAQAALAALRRLGESAPTVLVRDPARAGALRDTAERLGVAPRIVGGFPGIPLPAADVVISTVPAGAADALTDAAWDPATVLLDVVYAPWPTAPAVAATAAGCRVAGGLEVLLHQAVVQVELMTGLPGPTEAMAAALTKAAGDRRP